MEERKMSLVFTFVGMVFLALAIRWAVLEYVDA